MGAVGLRCDDGDAIIIMVGWCCDVEDIIRVWNRSCSEVGLEVRIKCRLRCMIFKVIGEKRGCVKRWGSDSWLGFEVSRVRC